MSHVASVVAEIEIDGREYVYWPILEGVPEDAAPLEFSFDTIPDWHPAEYVLDRAFVRLLIAGPDAEDNPAGTIVLPEGYNTARSRLSDNPESVIRPVKGGIRVG